jgi:hypothetical protein
MNMIGKLIGGMVGAKVAERARGGVGGPGGALIGALAIPLARRLGPVGLAAVALGGYAAKRLARKP